MKKSRSDRMYGDSPKLSRNTEGDVAVSKPSQDIPDEAGTEGGEADQANVNADGSSAEMGTNPEITQATERREVHHKHAKERLDIHSRHETEHSLHKGDKAELFARHEEEHKAMASRHTKELKDLHKRHMGLKEDSK